MEKSNLTRRRFTDGDNQHVPWQDKLAQSGESPLCPTYVHRAPPCQANCPSGHDIRSWLAIARGLSKPEGDMPWHDKSPDIHFPFVKKTQQSVLFVHS